MDPYIAGLPVYDERPENDLVFGVLTSVGYFFITIVLMIGVIMGDDQRYTVRKFSLGDDMIRLPRCSCSTSVGSSSSLQWALSRLMHTSMHHM